MKKILCLLLTFTLGVAFCGGVVSKPVEKNHKLEIYSDVIAGSFDAVTVASFECNKCELINCNLNHLGTAALVNVEIFNEANSIDLLDPGKYGTKRTDKLNKKNSRFSFTRHFYFTKNKYSKKMYCHFSPYHYLKVSPALYNDGSGSFI